jgi:transcriptional regulator, propionate catabolism operon regulatory protein
MISKICFISVSPEATALYREVLGALPEPPPIFGEDIKGALAAAQTAMRQGYEILITTERTARHLWGHLDTPIVAFPNTPFDIERAVYQAKNVYGEPVAFFDSGDPYISSPTIRNILQGNFTEFVYDGREDGLSKLRQAIREGFCAIVGGATITAMAHEVGIPCVPLLPSPEAILKTFEQAQQIASVRQIEKRQERKFEYVVQYSFSGTIVTDEENRIVVFNPAAEKIFGMPAGSVIGKSMDEVIPQDQLPGIGNTEHPQLEELGKIHNRQLMVNRIPIAEEGKVLGTIFSFQEASNIQAMEEKIRRASQVKGLTAKLRFSNIIGKSRILRETVLRAQRFASTDETILITGESGTGKEVFAQSIHNASARYTHPFLAVNCSAISPSLLESELFGYAEGAFTGARRGGKQGMFELSHQGTIFLDEIGELSREAQGHLLRVLQEKEVMRVGDAKITPVNIRVIAASNRPLEKDVQKGLFRWDLYHRLNVLQLKLPALREHPEDILALADSFITQWCPNRRLASQISKELSRHEARLMGYSWPGNIRELQNLLRRVMALAGTMEGDHVEQEIRELLAETFANPLALQPPMRLRGRGNLKSDLKSVAYEMIHKQHGEWHGSKKELAKKLGIGRTTLWRMLKDSESQ